MELLSFFSYWFLISQAEEHNDVNLLFSQLEGVLKRLGTVLGQPPLEQLLKAQGQIEAKHNSEQFADSGLTAGREPAFAQRSPKREGRKSFKIGQAEARDQKWETQLLKSKYLRVSGIRNQEGRTMWRTQTTFPGKRSWDPHSEWLYFPTGKLCNSFVCSSWQACKSPQSCSNEHTSDYQYCCHCRDRGGAGS